MKSINW